MKRDTHKVTNTSWFKLCPDCKKWFQILLKPPGIETGNELPAHCKKCSKDRSNLAISLFDEFNEAS